MNRGGYVFISHSHQDIEKIRKIRNRMEEAGYEPLCFYLKCLTDNDEIEDLIKREINAREWFVYADSANARASNWVRKEREYIDSLKSKQTITVDLDDEKSLDSVAGMLNTGLRVYIAYSRKDKDMAQKLAEALLRRDLQVYTGEDVKGGEEWKNARSDSLAVCETAGCVILIVSEDICSSRILREEISHATRHGAVIIPVVTEEYDFSENPQINRDMALLLKRDSERKDYDRIAGEVAERMGTNLRELFRNARSHGEVSKLYFDSSGKVDGKMLETMKEEADDCLEEERRIREDIEAALEAGTVKMTEEQRKKLNELY